jgi:tryptophan 2,3-dioxygenase
MAITYNSYLKIDELLALQHPLSDEPEHDELLFITIHQVYELWFKQVLHELHAVRARLEKDDLVGVHAGLKRTLTILKTLVSQVDILETMTPLSFNSFRARLETASGFQSTQFRVIEFLLGHRSVERLAKLPASSQAKLKPMLTEDTLYDAFLGLLSRSGFKISADILNRERSQAYLGNEAVQEQLILLYRNHPGLRDLCERLVDLDEGLQEWRYRHVKMVERTIGAKMGTGSSQGAAYLAKTLFQAIFPDLWAIRSRL